jgi:hypothetical protein
MKDLMAISTLELTIMNVDGRYLLRPPPHKSKGVSSFLHPEVVVRGGSGRYCGKQTEKPFLAIYDPKY